MRWCLNPYRAVCLLLFVVVALSLPGCTFGKQSFSEYCQYRWEDATEILELGITTSEKPQFAFYIDCLGSWPIGYGDVEGTYHGLGFGGIKSRPHYEHSVGYFFWGYEICGWDNYDKTKPETLNSQSTGIIGTWVGPEGVPQVLTNSPHAPRPCYFPGCVHYWHFGKVGLVWNIRYTEIVDFMAGFFFLDPWGDDGKQYGKWFWQKDYNREPTKEVDFETMRLKDIKPVDAPAAGESKTTEPAKPASAPETTTPAKPAGHNSEWVN